MALCVAWPLVTPDTAAAEPGSDLVSELTSAESKRGYHLFNPTPDRAMREMSTDRPDQTESAYTVDAGHFQLEMDIANGSVDRDGGDRSESWTVFPVNLKVGLHNQVDFQLMFDTYQVVEASSADGASLRQAGFGDITTRVKVNLWGNDGGPTAFALMPFVTFPVSPRGLGADALEGGLIACLAVGLPFEVGMGFMAEVDVRRRADDTGYAPAFIYSLTFGRDFTDRLGGYLEVFSEVDAQPGAEVVASLDGGITYALTDDVQLDMGLNVGLTAAADDVSPFLGISARF